MATKQDKTRNIVDLVQRFGERVSASNDMKERVYDLRGAARVVTRQQGLRVDFQILARGAEIHTSAWRGQMEPGNIVRGDDAAFDRIWRNATRIGGRIQAEQEAAQNEKIRATYEAHQAARLSGPAR